MKMFELGFRLVLPSMVIDPTDILGMRDINTEFPQALIICENRTGWVDIYNARQDIQSPFKDKNGKVLFDNDRVDINGVLFVLTYSDCWYLSNNVSITNCFARTFIEVEWKDIVAYGDSRNEPT